MKRRESFDYTTVGHVTADIMPDGSRRPGGSAFYSALQAARLGQRVLVLTQGDRAEIEALMDPYRGEFELHICASPETTTFQTAGSGQARSQRVLAWAGAMQDEIGVDTGILHLAPIARETAAGFSGRAEFVGLTPQGLVRDWSEESSEVRAAPPPERGIPRRCDALVMSEHERASCAELIARARRAGAVVAVTAGASPATILLAGERELTVEVPAIERPQDDVGAGDVFSAAFFVALAEGRDPRAAVEFANAAAAVRIAGEGAQAIGDREAIEDRLRAVARA